MRSRGRQRCTDRCRTSLRIVSAWRSLRGTCPRMRTSIRIRRQLRSTGALRTSKIGVRFWFPGAIVVATTSCLSDLPDGRCGSDTKTLGLAADRRQCRHAWRAYAQVSGLRGADQFADDASINGRTWSTSSSNTRFESVRSAKCPSPARTMNCFLGAVRVSKYALTREVGVMVSALP